MLSPTLSWPAAALLPYATLLRMPSTLPIPSLRLSVSWAKAFRRTGDFCATFSMKAQCRRRRKNRARRRSRPRCGAGRGSFNYRFAQPSRDAQPTSSIFFPTDVFPFTDQSEKDPVTGETGGLLDRAAADKVVPKIFFSNTSYEYWGRAAALIHVSADGKQDAPISSCVRIYHFTGLQTLFGPIPSRKG